MAGNYNRKIRYQKKYFNIYRKIQPKVKLNITRMKSKFNNLHHENKKQLAEENKKSFSLFDLFKF